MSIFLIVFNPVTAIVIAVVFLFASRSDRYSQDSGKTLLVFGIIFCLYAVWEFYMWSWRSSSGDHAIRADIVLLGPVMIFIAVKGFNLMFRGNKR